MKSLYREARACLECANVEEKLLLSRRLAQAWRQGLLRPGAAPDPVPTSAPGRPPRPLLVPPAQLASRKLSTPAGRAALLHALAHIEFNAINLACDTACRFGNLPAAFYGDWIAIAAEEAEHFVLLRQRLRDLGHDYGDFPAHDGLWTMACRTAHDPLARLALVPRTLEARGLDVTPGMIERLRQAGDPQSADILETILRDEIGHVAAGSRWFRYLCRQRRLEPLATFRHLLAEFLPRPARGPLNREARRLAGFNAEELNLLQQLSAQAP